MSFLFAATPLCIDTLIFSGKVVGKLISGLDSPTYLVHCHKTCQMVVVGNNKGPGGLAVFKVT